MKVPGSPLSSEVSPQAAAFFQGRHHVMKERRTSTPAHFRPSEGNIYQTSSTFSWLRSFATLVLTITVQVKPNKRWRSLYVVKQKCVLTVNTGGRLLRKQAVLLRLSGSRDGHSVVGPPPLHHRPPTGLHYRNSCGPLS